MAYDSNKLALKALEKLSVLGGGQDAPAEDFATAKDAIEPLLADLATREVIYIPDQDDIDPAYFLTLADRLAIEIAPSFEKQPADVLLVEARLRRLVAQGPAYTEQKGVYF